MNKKLTASGSTPLNYEWQYSQSTYGNLTKAPLVAGDRVIGITNAAVFAVDLYSGKEVKFTGGFPVRMKPGFGAPPLPAHSRGMLYFMDGGKLVARQLSDGKPQMHRVDGQLKPRWTPTELAHVGSITAKDDVVVVCQVNPYTTASGFDPVTGSRLWEPVRVSNTSPGRVAATRDALVFVSDGKLVSVNLRSGDTRFNFAPEKDELSITGSPQIGTVGDKAIVVTAGAAVYGVDLHTGKQLWVRSAAKVSSNLQWFTPAVSERYNRVILANSDSELIVLELTTGELKWSTKVPGLSQVKIIADNIYAETKDARTKLHVYTLASAEAPDVVEMEDPGRHGLVTGNGIFFIPGENSIRAFPFGDQLGALFNGTSSRIHIGNKEEPTQFDFRENDFTIETWICTTRGGEIVSGFPTTSGPEHHGFRVNVSDQGRLRFAVINEDASNSFAASSALTNVADGSWHHIAVVRRGVGVELYVDGISIETFTGNKGSNAFDISGKNALTFGAFVPNGKAQEHFSGLMREMRIWDIALDSAKLQSRMQRELIGTEPHLLGYWRMDEDISKLKNEVPRHMYSAEVNEVKSFVTELALDTSVFPYLLDQAQLQWPYAGHWSARAKEQVSTLPVLDRSSGVLAFGAGAAIYGVHSSDGSRAWSKPTPVGTSAPAASRGAFYVLTKNQGLISIDSSTGKDKRVKGFSGLTVDQSVTTRLPAPVANDRYVAAASPAGKVCVVEAVRINEEPGEHTWIWTAPGPISADLSMEGSRIYLLTNGTLHQLDPVEKKVKSISVAGSYHVSAGNLIFCEQTGGKIVALSATDLTQKATFTLPPRTAVTGLCASPDGDLLAVATDTGHLIGLTFATLKWRWTTQIPAGSAGAKNSLNRPVFDGRDVFCTTSSGTVAAVDANTGTFRGLFFEPTSITTPPLVDGGTVYFGCADAAPDAKLLDGALHSVVFGRTNVLRLGVDSGGKRDTSNAYASVTTGDVLRLLGVEQSCVEAWINTKSGGEIVSICPTEKSRYGLRLWLEENGAINFSSVDLPEQQGANWERLSGSVSSSACDGKWHHIAVSRTGRAELAIYLDGVALTPNTSLVQVGTPLLASGFKAFIGADATSAAPANFFAGLIGEVRVWDTFLTATRIAARMHDKLIGNEPDLLAYWNFDALAIHDGTRYGHEGKLEKGGESSGYWLANLNFTYPSYPSIETTGRIADAVSQSGGTEYELTVVARKADGTPLADHEVRLWYVLHKGESGPAKISVSSARGSAELKAVSPVHGDGDSLLVKTGNDGKIRFSINTSQRDHGPSLDLRPAYLPANERYHVNVLIDNQKLEKPAPPRLDAQAKLMQDYHWSTGDKVNEKRDRMTWRAVITARNSDGRPRAGERLQLWATEHVEVEVDGRFYPINPNNYQLFTADENGELTVSLAANELRAPALSVWAGFMHREERYTIPLDREAHKTLSEIKADDLAKPRMANWTPDGPVNKEIVKEGYKPHAGKVATAIQQVMSVTQEPAKGLRSGLQSKRARLRVDTRDFGDMLQVEPEPSSDNVQSLRTLSHIERQVPLEPESFMQSLSHLNGFENGIGFMFEKGKLELEPIHNVAQVDEAFNVGPLRSPKLLGNIFEDAWNAIESAAEAIAREVKKIAIYIADQVTLVIQYADEVVKKVVNTVKEAVEAVVHILKMIEAFIEDVIRFLAALFDWSAILEAHRILKQLANQQLRAVRQLTDRGKDEFLKMLTSVFDGSASTPLDISKHAASSTNASTCRSNDRYRHVGEQVNSVQGKYVNDKVDAGKDEIILHASPSIHLTEALAPKDAEAMAKDLVGSLSGAFTDPLGMSFAEIYEAVSSLLSGDIKGMVMLLLKSSVFAFDKLGSVIDCMQTLLNAKIEIPFLSQLYKWITHEDLTLLDVSCLAIAIPTHMGYVIFTKLLTGTERKFADDAKGLVNPLLSAGQLDGDAPLVQATVKADTLALHWAYFAYYEAHILTSGILKLRRVADSGRGWRENRADQYLVLMAVTSGMVSKIQLFMAGSADEDWDDLESAWHTSLFIGTLAVDLYTAVDAFILEDSPAGAKPSMGKDLLKIAFSVIGLALLIKRIVFWVQGTSKGSDLAQTRDVLNAIGLMLTFDTTDLYVNLVGKKGAAFTVGGEMLVKAAAGAVHIANIATRTT